MNAVTSTTTLIFLLTSLPAYAYLGPGVGLSAIGSIVAFIGTLLLLLIGFVWYPLKRLLNFTKRKRDNGEENVDHNERGD